MESKRQSSAENVSEPELQNFGLQTPWGLAKHTGGLEATRELIEACHIDKDSYVLDVGCGVGITACYLAGEYGCRIVGVDVSETMVKQSKERARRKDVADKVEIKIGDAQALPFKDAVFDAVICESVTAFPKDKQKVVSEYARVTRPGGYVGMNEGTWVKTPPPELADYLFRALGQAKFLTPNGWRDLLERAGLTDIVTRVDKTNALYQSVNGLRQMNPGDYLRAWGKFVSLIFRDSAARNWIKEIGAPPRKVFTISRYFGYGIYTGRK